MKSALYRARVAVRSWWVWGLCWAICLQPLWLRAAETSQTVFLEYVESSNQVQNVALQLEAKSGAFPKEPEFGQRKLERGTLKFGNDSKNAVPFVWDYTQGKLYLDLNRNGNLTDDPAGVFSCPVSRVDQSFDGYCSQNFDHVRISVSTPAGTQTILMDLNLYRWSRNVNASARVRSFWQGKVDLQGQAWQVGWLPSLNGPIGGTNGVMLLRPWLVREKTFSTHDGTLQIFNFSRQLFFQKQAYQLEMAWVEQGRAPHYQITFAPQTVALGELKLSGKYIQRLMLDQGSHFKAIVDAPAATLSIPAGTYSQISVHLKQGASEASRDADRSTMSVTVNAQKTANLVVGGPLTNSVTVQRRGSAMLSFNYQLLGADGHAYRRLGVNQSEPPQVTISQGGKQIASGKFQYG
ncbi:MAG: hypothetical protein WCO56_21525 [Verrucomicrobiota bacterium]